MSNSFIFKHEKLFLNKELIQLSNNRFEKIHQENIYQTNLKHVCEIEAKSIKKEPLFLGIMNEIHKKLQTIINVSDLKFKKLWLVNSFPKNTNHTSLPYIPHIDKIRYLKAMVYLHDVSLKHGPINLGKVKNNINIEQKRKELPEDYKKNLLNTINDEQIAGNLISMVGKAGDTIFFDTNTPHKAGIIEKGYSRKVLRFDFDRPFFNTKPSILELLINKFR